MDSFFEGVAGRGSVAPAPKDWRAGIVRLRKACYDDRRDDFDRAPRQYRMEGYNATGTLVWTGVSVYSEGAIGAEAQRIYRLVKGYRPDCELQKGLRVSPQPFAGLGAHKSDEQSLRPIAYRRMRAHVNARR